MNNSPVSQYERPRGVALASSACVDKTTKIITEFTPGGGVLTLTWYTYRAYVPAFWGAFSLNLV